jgi:hypothetical protein
MGARDLLARLDGLGVTVAADGDRLLIRPASMLTDALRAELRAAKPEVLALLAERDRQPIPSVLHPFPAVSLSGNLTASKVEADTGEADRKERPNTGDAARFEARRARLVRWGWPPDEAQALAERLALRDLAGDDLASCTECASYRPGRCGNHRRAGMCSPEVGRDLAAMLQRCPGFKR